MKAISLWQPFASLIAVGSKKYETRSWATKHRGPLLICAAARTGLPELCLLDILRRTEFREALAPSIGFEPKTVWPPIQPKHLPFGKAVAIVELVDCIRTEDMTAEQIGTDKPFGDFSPGRFAWQLENVKAIEEPFPVKGRQGLFEVDDSMLIGKITE
jgi:hypothetical protein